MYHHPSTTPPPLLSCFTPATTDEVRRTISGSSNSSCALDIISTFLLKSCTDALIEPITTLINLSLSEGIFPSDFKSALVRPLHKKHSLRKMTSLATDLSLFLLQLPLFLLA